MVFCSKHPIPESEWWGRGYVVVNYFFVRNIFTLEFPINIQLSDGGQSNSIFLIEVSLEADCLYFRLKQSPNPRLQPSIICMPQLQPWCSAALVPEFTSIWSSHLTCAWPVLDRCFWSFIIGRTLLQWPGQTYQWEHRCRRVNSFVQSTSRFNILCYILLLLYLTIVINYYCYKLLLL